MSCVSRFFLAGGLLLAVAVALAARISESRAERKDRRSRQIARQSGGAGKKLVDLFDAMKNGDIDVKFIAKNSREGQLWSRIRPISRSP